MARQRKLPGIPQQPTAADRKAFIQWRLLGYELRQQERARKRSRREQPAASEPEIPAWRQSQFPFE